MLCKEGIWGILSWEGCGAGEVLKMEAENQTATDHGLEDHKRARGTTRSARNHAAPRTHVTQNPHFPSPIGTSSA